MKRSILVLAGTAALAMSTVPAAGAAGDSAAQRCKEQRTSMGKAAFRQAYGTNRNKANAFGRCVEQAKQAAQQAQDAAATACRTEQQADPAAFAEKYGTGKKQKNALRKCISAQSEAEVEERQEAAVSAAQECRAERGTTAESREAFAQKYGTNRNKANAFGKSARARARAAA